MKVGERIKLYLVENKIPQKSLSEATGIPRDKLSLSLNGERGLKPEELELILYALKVQPDKFIIPRAPNRENRNSA